MADLHAYSMANERYKTRLVNYLERNDVSFVEASEGSSAVSVLGHLIYGQERVSNLSLDCTLPSIPVAELNVH